MGASSETVKNIAICKGGDRMKKRVLLLLLMASLLGSVLCVSQSSAAYNAKKYAKEVIRLVNVQRAKKGLPKVKATKNLSKAANLRAKEIRKKFAHERPNGASCFQVLNKWKISYTMAGENIAYGMRTPKQVVKAWMNSSGHRRNILTRKFNRLGVGVYKKKGLIYWTQLFIRT